ncbi:hypothetical protein ACHHYP_12371 [Achlya hypogyna]|uniref:Alpha-galactosidase n=1 Tax=Achlya hypogyna TaxID=1202772 RepID=A0A1V9YHD6_ACHHY|nr:hypothetical protein ACHHYP_12371 [Achlya hypogyna]
MRSSPWLLIALAGVRAATPLMGWSGWTTYANTSLDCMPTSTYPRCLSDALYESIADDLATKGYRDAGYSWIDIEDGWAATRRDAFGQLNADPVRFPHGLAGLVASVQSKGMNMGIGVELGPTTCKGLTGSAGHYEIDIQTLAAANISRLLVHACSFATDTSSFYFSLATLSTLAQKQSLPMHLHCVFDRFPVNATLVATFCSTVQTTSALPDRWGPVQAHIHSLLHHPSSDTYPGGLVVGGYALTLGQSRIQLGVWLLLHAPLIVNLDPWVLDERVRDLLLRPEVADLTLRSQPKAPPTRLALLPAGVAVWRRSILLNATPAILVLVLRLELREPQVPVPVVLELDDIVGASCVAARVRDVWSGNAARVKFRFNTTIAPLDAQLFVVQPVAPSTDAADGR